MKQELLKCKLETSELKLENSELRHKVANLEKALQILELELQRSNRLLLKQRLPARPKFNSTQKALIAAEQQFKCIPVDGQICPLSLTNDSLFDGSLWEIDHINPWSVSGNDRRSNKVARCPHCHSFRTRQQLANGELRRYDSDSDSD